MLFFMACANSPVPQTTSTTEKPKEEIKQRLQMGAERFDEYLPKLKGKSVGLVANQTARVHYPKTSGNASTMDSQKGDIHLADYLLQNGIRIKTIFSPEHGFRGKADAGAKVKDGKDPITGLPVISLYGKNRKPQKAQLEGIDIMVFDIQDVGVRYYTYIGTLHYMMEACAENHIPLIILDRPNPNGHYVDGPILDPSYRSFVGMHEVPIVHGMTIGEYGRMINEEGWLKDGVKVDLQVVACANYTHEMPYALPLKPSPNLPNFRSILLYPSLCLFEGTVISIGRGTDKQFQVIGHPDLPKGNFSFTPKPMPGALHPKLEGKLCNGLNLSELDTKSLYKSKQINIEWLVKTYHDFPDKEHFFLKNLFFDKLAGGDVLRKQIVEGLTAKEIRDSWQDGLERFKKIRGRYLLYD